MNNKNDDSTRNTAKNKVVDQQMYKDLILEEHWLELIDKHELRYEIWALLKLYNELNVTQISNLIKSSKSTVSRILIGMEKDNLLVSRREVKKEGEGEKIPPKFYCLNKEFIKETRKKIVELELPTDPQKLRDFYISEVVNYRNAIFNIHKLLDLLNPLLNVFEDQLDDIEKAKRIYDSYLSGKNEPWFNIMYFDHERYERFLDMRLEYMLKLEKLAMEQNLDTKNAFIYMDASLPLKAIFEIKKNKFLK